jgi:hypothetical protein
MKDRKEKRDHRQDAKVAKFKILFKKRKKIGLTRRDEIDSIWWETARMNHRDGREAKRLWTLGSGLWLRSKACFAAGVGGFE